MWPDSGADICGEGLLWVVYEGHPPFRSPGATRLVPPLAPTWSWASINGKITYGHRNTTHILKDLEEEDLLAPVEWEWDVLCQILEIGDVPDNQHITIKTCMGN
jgi:hypothetical protein